MPRRKLANLILLVMAGHSHDQRTPAVSYCVGQRVSLQQCLADPKLLAHSRITK